MGIVDAKIIIDPAFGRLLQIEIDPHELTYRLYRARAKWFVLQAFFEELERQGVDPGPFIPQWHGTRPPRDPFEPIPPVLFHETGGIDHGPSALRYFAEGLR